MKVVILPGMDGTGVLLKPFVAALNERGVDSQVVAYPTDEVLGYEDLIARVADALPGPNEDFVLLAESFSGPIALALAQRELAPSLRGLVLVVTFAEPPDSLLLALTKMLPVKWILSQPIPCWLTHKVMLGSHEPEGERDAICTVVKQISPAVLTARLEEVRKLEIDDRPIDLPACYIQAGEDQLLPSNVLTGIIGRVPGIQIYRVGGPHLVLDTAPSACADVVRAFLDTLVGDAA